MDKNKVLVWALSLSISFFVCPLIAKELADNRSIPKLSSQVELDGLLDEAIWKEALNVKLLYETEPAENIDAKVTTQAYIFEDGEYLYIGFQAQDPGLDLLRASYRDRDDISDEDHVGIEIDTFNDQRRSYNFFVNPLGIQKDSISDDVLDREDSSWNAIWFSAGKVTADGYSVEIKIPFKILRFKDSAEKQWSINFVRSMPRDYKYRFASNPVDRDINCTICQYQQYDGLKDIERGNNIELIPYLFASKTDTRDFANNQDWQSGSVDTEAGLDMRWAIDDSSVLNVAVNPDFSQVEADAAQFDVNTRFALFFDEKRPFFLEGADYFNTMLTIFYSRNIADPDFGAKYTGKIGDASLGILASRDQTTNIIVPSSQSSSLVTLNSESDAAAFRYAYDLTDSSLLGVTMTRRSADDYSNDLISFDGKHQLTDSDVFRYQLIHTETKNPLAINAGQNQSGSAYRINYSHNDRDWSYYASHNHFDKGFRADLGFLTRSGYRKTIIGAGRRWYGDADDFLSRIEFRSDWDTTVQYDGQKLETELEASLNLQGRNQSRLDFEFGGREVFFDNRWFDQDFYEVNISFRPWNNTRLGVAYAYSDDIDFLSSSARAGETEGYSFFIDWQANRHFNAFFEWEEQSFDVAQGKFFDSSVANARFIYQFNEKSFIRFLIRYSSTEFTQDSLVLQGLNVSFTDKNLIKQLLYAYKLDAKSVFYFGYSDRAIEDDVVTSLEEDTRTIFAKFSYAFQL